MDRRRFLVAALAAGAKVLGTSHPGRGNADPIARSFRRKRLRNSFTVRDRVGATTIVDPDSVKRYGARRVVIHVYHDGVRQTVAKQIANGIEASGASMLTAHYDATRPL
jgi:hypothetical protein